MQPSAYDVYAVATARGTNITAHCAVRLVDEPGQMRVDMCLYGDHRSADASEWEPGETPGGPAYHFSGICPGALEPAARSGLIALIAEDVDELLVSIFKKSRRLDDTARTFQVEVGAIEKLASGAHARQRTIVDVRGFLDEGTRIEESLLMELGHAFGKTLAHYQHGYLQRHISAAAESVPAREPIRIKITPAFRDKLIDQGVMPLPKNLQPRDGMHYNPRKSCWEKD